MSRTPNPENPLCSICGAIMAKNGLTNQGSIRYRCKCGHNFTHDKKRSGRSPIGDRAMTNSERQKKFREREKKT